MMMESDSPDVSRNRIRQVLQANLDEACLCNIGIEKLVTEIAAEISSGDSKATEEQDSNSDPELTERYDPTK